MQDLQRRPSTSNLSAEIRNALQQLDADVQCRLVSWLSTRTPEAFRALELEIARRMRKSGDEMMSAVLRALLCSDSFQDEAVREARASALGPYRSPEQREVSVTLLGGTQIKVPTKYLRRDRSGQPGRQRKSGRRGKSGSGLHPALATLGVCFGVTPAAAGEICRQVADSDSVRAGREALARRDLDLGHKETLRIVNGVGRRLIEQRNGWGAMALERPPQHGPLSGKRVVISADGGRIRERKPRRHGRKRANGHRPYDAPWREPKLFAVYIIDGEGNVDHSFRPIYDGTLGNCDLIFGILLAYLKSLGAHEAEEIAILGDGAKWIWERAGVLAEALQLPAEKITQIVDWYHAVETLGTIAAARARWSDADRAAWIEETKTFLYNGDTQAVLDRIDALSKGRNAKSISNHRDYFARNTARMNYAAFVACHLPIGSGAVESAIRRVINMRLKGNGTFWLEKNAEAMLMMRAYLKAGRFDDLFVWSLKTAAPWTNEHSNAGPIREQELHSASEILVA